MTDSARDKQDVYGSGFIKAKRLAIKRSGGRCQFCGLRKASEGHHWAWDYPLDDKVQGHDITALCVTCHELATMLRDWVQRKHASFDEIEEEIRVSSNFYEKREAFSYWLFPEEEEEYGRSFFHSTHNTSKKKSGSPNFRRSSNSHMEENRPAHSELWFWCLVIVGPFFLIILMFHLHFLRG